MHVSYWRENEPTKMAETNLRANALSFVATWKFFVWDRNNTNTIFFYLCLVWYFLFVSVFRSLLDEPFTSENLISDSISRADLLIRWIFEKRIKPMSNCSRDDRGMWTVELGKSPVQKCYRGTWKRAGYFQLCACVCSLQFCPRQRCK